MVTIKDVAAAAGVSATTVSNVIHGYKSRVSKATTEKILNVIDELGYIPNMSARSLVSNSSHVVALVRHDPSADAAIIPFDPFFLRGLLQIERSINKAGYYMMVHTCTSSRDLVVFLQNWNADGLFVSGPIDNEFAQTLIKSGKPVVQVDTGHPWDDLSYVLQDDYMGGCLIASYLLEKGHTKIGFAMRGTPEMAQSYDRLCGFKDTLKKAGHPLDESLLFIADEDNISFSEDKVTAPIQSAAEAGMTALAVASDPIALYLISALNKKGVRIPEDLSITGYGNLPQGIISDPALTTIHYSVEAKTEHSVASMLRMLCAECEPPVQVRIPVSLVERGSVRSL